jgi:hypothetical protein
MKKGREDKIDKIIAMEQVSKVDAQVASKHMNKRKHVISDLDQLQVARQHDLFSPITETERGNMIERIADNLSESIGNQLSITDKDVKKLTKED